jgi:hypothetical protein
MSQRVWSPIAKRMVPQADRAAVAAYMASPRAKVDTWLAFERAYHLSLEED